MVIRPLPEALQKIAIEELKEDPKRIESDLQAFKLWIEQQPHLKARTTDQFLIAFLRGCKYSLEKSKLKLDNYYALKEKYPEFLATPNLNSEKFKKLLKLGIILYLPKPLTESGPRVVLVRNGVYDAGEYGFADVAQMRRLIQDIVLLEDDVSVVGGLVFIMDFSDVTASHFFQVSPSNMRKVSQYSEQAVPLRVKATHFIDTPAGFEPVFNLIKPLMSEKIQNRMFVHGAKREELFKIIPKEILPTEYGGDNGSVQDIIDYWEKKVLSYAEYFKEDDEKYGVDETLRIKNEPNASESLGLVGSFRKLMVD